MFSCWLSEDELEIWYLGRNGSDHNILYAYRTHLDSAFSAADTVRLAGDWEGFIAGPSLTPDRSQLFLFNSPGGILIFDETGTNQYMLADTMYMPDGVLPDPGQLSRDGYKFYFTFVGMGVSSARIASFNRFDLSDTFNMATFEILPEEINDPLRLTGQPTVTADGNTLVFVSSTSNSWSANDLASARGMGCATATEDHLTNDFQWGFFPNPSRGQLSVWWKIGKPGIAHF